MDNTSEYDKDLFDWLVEALVERGCPQEQAVETVKSIQEPRKHTDIESLIAQVRKEHPYRVIGDFDTYTDFNQGWQDALDRLDSLLPTVE